MANGAIRLTNYRERAEVLALARELVQKAKNGEVTSLLAVWADFEKSEVSVKVAGIKDPVRTIGILEITKSHILGGCQEK